MPGLGEGGSSETLMRERRSLMLLRREREELEEFDAAAEEVSSVTIAGELRPLLLPILLRRAETKQRLANKALYSSQQGVTSVGAASFPLGELADGEETNWADEEDA